MVTLEWCGVPPPPPPQKMSAAVPTFDTKCLMSGNVGIGAVIILAGIVVATVGTGRKKTEQ